MSQALQYNEIIDLLKPLDPDKIILFGSYAQNTASEESDVDICLIKDDQSVDLRQYSLKARKQLRNWIMQNKKGFDIISIRNKDLETKKDYFYRIDLKEQGKVLYAK